LDEAFEKASRINYHTSIGSYEPHERVLYDKMAKEGSKHRDIVKEVNKQRKQQWPQKSKTGKLGVHQRRKMLSNRKKGKRGLTDR
jgi:hypothetical protein